MECRKVRYLTQPAAESMVRWMRDRKPDMKKADRARLSAYRCNTCGFWHVGKERLREGA